MDKIGVAPLDPDTPVGQMRMSVGDTTYTDENAGYGEYEHYSDIELQMYLDKALGSVTRALGYLYTDLAAVAALQSKMVKDYDLQVDLRNRAEQLRETAQTYFDLADQEDTEAGVADIFDSFNFGAGRKCCRPEAAPRYCNCVG